MTKRRSLKKSAKILVDAALYGVMLILMSYPITRGLLRHGVCGVAFMALLLVHQALNAGWYRSLFRGRWNARRVLLTATDALLLFNGAALAVSSLAMAGEVFSFAPFPMTWWARDLHTTATAWTFVLTSFHLGLHGHGVWRNARLWTSRIWPFVVLAFFALGTALFAHSGLWNVMLMNGIPQTRLAGLPLFLAYYPAMTLWLCLLARGAWSFMGKPCFRNGC